MYRFVEVHGHVSPCLPVSSSVPVIVYFMSVKHEYTLPHFYSLGKGGAHSSSSAADRPSSVDLSIDIVTVFVAEFYNQQLLVPRVLLYVIPRFVRRGMYADAVCTNRNVLRHLVTWRIMRSHVSISNCEWILMKTLWTDWLFCTSTSIINIVLFGQRARSEMKDKRRCALWHGSATIHQCIMYV